MIGKPIVTAQCDAHLDMDRCRRAEWFELGIACADREQLARLFLTLHPGWAGGKNGNVYCPQCAERLRTLVRMKAEEAQKGS